MLWCRPIRLPVDPSGKVFSALVTSTDSTWSGMKRLLHLGSYGILLSIDGSGCLDASAVSVLSVMGATVSLEHRSRIVGLKLSASSLLLTADATAVRCDLVFVFLVWLAVVGGLSSLVHPAVLLLMMFDRFRRAPLS